MIPDVLVWSKTLQTIVPWDPQSHQSDKVLDVFPCSQKVLFCSVWIYETNFRFCTDKKESKSSSGLEAASVEIMPNKWGQMRNLFVFIAWLNSRLFRPFYLRRKGANSIVLPIYYTVRPGYGPNSAATPEGAVWKFAANNFWNWRKQIDVPGVSNVVKCHTAVMVATQRARCTLGVVQQHNALIILWWESCLLPLCWVGDALLLYCR